jgi:hypothetical protein
VVAVDIRTSPSDDTLLTAECGVDARAGVEAAIARVVAGRWDLHRLERQQPTLENVFLRYVKHPPSGNGAP